MPDSIMKKVEQFDKTNTTPNVFNFSNRNGVLFEGNGKVDECLEGIVEEDVVLHPSLAAEIPGIVLDPDQPIPSIEDKPKYQGCAEDAAARNANMELFNVAGVEALTIVCANYNNIDNIDDDNNVIMTTTTTLQANNLDPLVLSDTSQDDNANDNLDKWSHNDLLQEGNPGIQGDAGVDKPEDD